MLVMFVVMIAVMIVVMISLVGVEGEAVYERPVQPGRQGLAVSRGETNQSQENQLEQYFGVTQSL